MALTDAAIRSAPTADRLYRLKDRDGLFVEVRPTGKKVWVHRHSIAGRERTETLGEYPTLTLAAARNRVLDIRSALRDGRDPRTGGAVEPDTSDRFQDVARLWFEAQKPSWKPAHAERVWSRLERDALPFLGSKGIQEIEAPDVLAMLQRVEKRGALDISKRLRQAVSAIYVFAIASGRASRNPAEGLNAALKKRPQTEHMKTLAVNDLSELFRRMNAFGGEERTKLAIRLTLHTAVRTNEILNALADDIQRDLWVIPGERMKKRRDHVIPLTPQSRAILERLDELRQSERLVDIQPNSMIHMLYNLGYRGQQTVHGFRSMFSTAANDSGLWTADAIERSLAHVPGNKVRSAYNRAQYMDERRRLMCWWSALIEAQEEEAELLG